ncbi:pyridoxamine 5'-phosphate oxidase family protein [uncultured Gimesia sp.]|uniref:pyridoxamine 5'-phosphate oxidase family protein n=1 Tax=uncultured Gimesia sp. TaxID=1678688 RepID=UPI0030D9D441|tara:strand:+ start:6471 stop:7082 length:612 start_codon:yes stop_codon:yes gene_type:complete
MTRQFEFNPAKVSTILDETWQHLTSAIETETHPWRLGQLATAAEGRPRVRTVVLRDVQPESRELICYTDRRSDKVSELEESPWIEWVTYDPITRVQIRLRGSATIHSDAARAAQHWQDSSPEHRRGYITVSAPGTKVDSAVSNLPDYLFDRLPNDEEAQLGFENFAVIVCRIEHLDWLQLRRNGHLAAQFLWTDKWEGHWKYA